jgi:hypothetical protein
LLAAHGSFQPPSSLHELCAQHAMSLANSFNNALTAFLDAKVKVVSY